MNPIAAIEAAARAATTPDASPLGKHFATMLEESFEQRLSGEPGKAYATCAHMLMYPELSDPVKVGCHVSYLMPAVLVAL